AQRQGEAGNTANQGQKVVLATDPSHSLEKLSPVENADAVEEHDQAGQSDGPDDLCLRTERAEREPYEQDCADTEREPTDIDLPDQVTNADRQKRSEDWLGTDDVAGKVYHGNLPAKCWPMAGSADPASCGTELCDHALGQFRRRRGRVGAFVLELHRFPLESTHLVERLHLYPFDVPHGRDKFGDAFDVFRVVRPARNE